MDHLPKIKGSFQRLPRVPYFPNEKYQYEAKGDPKNLSSFGYSSGYGLAKFDQDDFFVENSSFLQEWLFFGPIKELCWLYGLPFRQQDFIEHVDGLDYVTLRRLPWYLVAWLVEEKQHHGNCLPPETEMTIGFKSAAMELRNLRFCLPKDERQQRASIVRKILVFSSRRWQQFRNNRNFLDEIWDSIGVLGLYLETAATNIFRCQIVSFRQFSLYRAEECRTSSTLFDNSAWCPRERNILAHVFNNNHIVQLLASQLPRSGDSRAHSSCNKSTCHAYQVNEELYRTKHVESCANSECRFLGSNNLHNEKSFQRLTRKSILPDQLRSVSVVTYKAGQLIWSEVSPFRGLSQDTAGYMKLWSGGFVAISHVWADGLGNPHSNSLPQCQVERLQAKANQLFPERSGGIPIWMDSLCLPREQTIRKYLIGQMYRIYQAATKILVLDEALQCVQSDGLSNEELALRIICCPWSRRLWTLQEAGMMHKTYFLFADGMVDFEQIKNGAYTACSVAATISRIPRDHKLHERITATLSAARNTKCPINQTNLGRYIDHALSPFWNDIMSYFDCQRWTRLKSCAAAFNAEECMLLRLRNVMCRNTSKPDDEGVLIASISYEYFSNLSVSPSEISKTPRHERTRKLFTSFSHVSPSIIFWNQQRYAEYGSRWIPKTLLTNGNPNFQCPHPGKNTFDDNRPGWGLKVVNENGLLVQLPSFSLAGHHFNSLFPYFYLKLRIDEESDIAEFYRAFVHYPGGEDAVDQTTLFDKDTSTAIVLVEEAAVALPLSMNGALVTRIQRDESTWDMVNGFRTRFEALVKFQYINEDDINEDLTVVEVNYMIFSDESVRATTPWRVG